MIEVRHEPTRSPTTSTVVAISLAILVAFYALALAPVRAEAADPNVTAEALAAMPPLDTLAEEETPLSREGAWAPLDWVMGPGSVQVGWSSIDPYPDSDGVYWTRSTFADGGPGDAAVARLLSAPGVAGRSISLWLNMPTPQTRETGYELRLQEQPFPGVFMVTLKRFEEGSPAFLAGVERISLSSGDQFAIVDQGATLSAWVDDAGWNGKADFRKILTARDGHFESGYVGMQATTPAARVRRFKAGSLAFSSF